MKKLKTGIFAAIMVLSMVFVGQMISSGDTSMSASAQQTTVRRKRKVGATRRIYRGGKWVGTQVWNGSKWVARKSWHGGKWVVKKTYKGGRKVVSRTKKIVY
jgi:hypothetical protein